MPLSAAQILELQGANRNSVEQAFAALSQNWQSSFWLPKQHRYRAKCIQRITADLGPNRRINGLRLQEYIVASTATHCLDGWAYLGKAVHCHLQGDCDVARHLAYYAELRAAMALLAAEGVGLFDREHFVVVNGRKRCVQFSPHRSLQKPERPRGDGTHRFAWAALEEWSKLPVASELLFQIIAPGGKPLQDWFDAFPVPGGVQQILAAEWFGQWGLDLQRLTQDRDARNLASYRPTAFTSPRPGSVLNAIDFVSELWGLCEPRGAMRFHLLDRHLLRTSLELAFVRAFGRSRKQMRQRYKQMVEAMLHQVAPEDLQEAEWVEFLTNDTVPTAPLLLEAAGRLSPYKANHHKQVLARATMLLRTASGACERLLKLTPGFQRNLISFWWEALAEDRALWHPGEQPANFGELWLEANEALDGIDHWRASAQANPASYKRLWRDCSYAATVLGSCERIGLWGIGL